MAGRALVLGGGGVTGIAWELGVLAGLAAAGTDLTTADVIVGTSAGASVAAQMTSGASLEELYRHQLRAPEDEQAARVPLPVIARYVLAYLGHPRNGQGARKAIGRLALRARTVPEAERRAIIASRLPERAWPSRPRLLLTAVDAHSGEGRVFDADSGVGLIDAVAASCAVPGVWPPVTVDGRRYYDGGFRAGTLNADLAAGCDRVVVLAPISRDLGPASAKAQVGALARAGAAALLVHPDRAAVRAIGRNVLDPARRAAAAEAGLHQAATIADAAATLWSA